MGTQRINLAPQQVDNAEELLADMRATADVLNEQWKAAVWWTFGAFAICCVNGILFKRNIRTMNRMKK